MIFKGRQLDKRIFIIIVFFCLLWGGLFFKSAQLQLFPNKKLSKLQNKLFERTIVLKPRRGTIYDSKNKELAISIPSQSLFADPQKIEKPYYAAKKLSQLLNISRSRILKRLINKKRKFVWIKRHLKDSEIQKIQALKFEGLHFIKENKRFYTNQDSLSQVLGFTGLEGQGLEGIEKQYDELLKGKPQKTLIQRDARGRPLFTDFSPFISKVSGFDIYLTINSDLQFYLEQELKQAIVQSKAKSAIGIVLSAESSEVLAMANIPTYDPNQIKNSLPHNRRNRAVTDIFEPGSTLKTFTLISALQNGISPTQIYSSHKGYLKIGKAVITEADPKKKFKDFLNLSEILAFSSNIGAASIALDLGSEKLRRTLESFGFGDKTGIDFPGESKGLLRPLPWRKVETATVGFGHGIAGTALQVANSYASIANGGILRKPFLLKKIKNPYTGEKKYFKSQIIRRVLDPEEARTLSLMLTSAVGEEGTGAKAIVPGYFIAGKTGTAQKVDLKNKGYKQGEYISSFAGFIPAHKPKFVIYLVIDGAQNNFYASSLVAPLFAQTASYLLRKAGISPTLLTENNIFSDQNQKKKSITKKDKYGQIFKSPATKKRQIASLKNTVPYLQDLSLREVLKKTKNTELQFKIFGSGKLSHSIPSAGEPIPKNKQIRLFFK